MDNVFEHRYNSNADAQSVVHAGGVTTDLRYTNALILLPNGKFANINEAGNYLIGYAGIMSSPNFEGQLYSVIINQDIDEPWKQRLLSEGDEAGSFNYDMYMRRKINRCNPGR